MLVAVCVVVPAAGLAYALGHGSGNGAPTTHIQAGIGKPAPAFTLPAVGGGHVSLAQYRGKPVVIAFFASWCHPCEEELPVLQKAHEELGSKVQILGVNYQDHVGTDSADFVHQLKVEFPALLEPDDDRVAAQYGVHEIPETFFVDSSGVIRDHIFGQLSHHDVREAIAKLT